MKSAWGPDLCDVAAWNAAQVEDINDLDFEQMLIEDVELEGWDKYCDDSDEWP